MLKSILFIAAILYLPLDTLWADNSSSASAEPISLTGTPIGKYYDPSGTYNLETTLSENGYLIIETVERNKAWVTCFYMNGTTGSTCGPFKFLFRIGKPVWTEIKNVGDGTLLDPMDVFEIHNPKRGTLVIVEGEYPSDKICGATADLSGTFRLE
jgi:hypothetical protein